MTWMEEQLLATLRRLERHYNERDAAMLERLQSLTQKVESLTVQVDQLAQALRRLTPG